MPLLRIKYFDNSEVKPMKGAKKTLEGCLKCYEKHLAKNSGAWAWAVAYYQESLYCYYHYSTGTQQLDKKGYAKALKDSSCNLYLVYSYEHKTKTGNYKGKTIPDASISDMPKYSNYPGVEKVEAYKGSKLIKTYQNGRWI